MGKASRRKRERTADSPGAAGPDAKSRSGQRSGWLRPLLATVIAAGLLLLGFGAWQAQRGVGVAAPPVIVLPNPDTSGMSAPVARALEAARDAALASPPSADAIGRYGQVLHAHWLLEAAERCYEIAHDLAPGDFRWVYLLAGVAEIRGADGERVDLLFRDAIHLAPFGFAPIYVRHADALMRLGRWSEARDSYARAAELDPELVLAHRGMGQALILVGDGSAAVEHLERAASLSPGDRIAQVALARAHALAGDDQRAAEASARAEAARGSAALPDPFFYEVERLAVDPESLRARYASSLRKGDIDAAAEAASLLAEGGDPAASRQLPLAVKQHANRLAFEGDFEGALASYEQAARLAPADPEIEHNWGTVLLRRGDLEGAASHFERAVEIEPQSADSLYNLGVALEGLGRRDEAIGRFTAAAGIDPRHAAAQRLAELGVEPVP